MSTKKHIFILHGWAYSVEKWQPFLDLLSKDFEYSFLKIPGLTSKLDETWDLDNYVEWLSEKLSNKKQAILLGHSNGGRISLAFAHKYPKKVENLILIDSAGLVDKRFKTILKKKVFKTLAKIGKIILPLPFFRKILYKLTRESDYYNTPPKLRQTMQNLISIDLRPILSQIKTTSLIIWGEDDQITLVSDAFELKNGLENSQLVFIKKAKHAPMFTHPQEVFNTIKEFLK
jgi:pimeloyl-ACP methyl ester carboxylesterase